MTKHVAGLNLSMRSQSSLFDNWDSNHNTDINKLKKEPVHIRIHYRGPNNITNINENITCMRYNIQKLRKNTLQLNDKKSHDRNDVYT